MLEPRYTPSWVASGREEFLGYAGELDLYFEDGEDDPVLVVGDRQTRHGNTQYNFDQYGLRDGILEVVGPPDVHVELHEMCEIYQLLEQHGYIKRSE